MSGFIPPTVVDETAIRSVLWFFGHEEGREPGHFWRAQLEAFALADRENFQRLYSAFPIEAFWFDAVRSSELGIEAARCALSQLEVAS